MSSSSFPDVNVWLALASDRHTHHSMADDWFKACAGSIFFCRMTQLGLLRLLTNPSVMGNDVCSQDGAWAVHLRFRLDSRVQFHPEPHAAEIDRFLIQYGRHHNPSAKLWNDAYLAAFARCAGLTLITFDRGFQKMRHLEAKVLS